MLHNTTYFQAISPKMTLPVLSAFMPYLEHVDAKVALKLLLIRSYLRRLACLSLTFRRCLTPNNGSAMWQNYSGTPVFQIN